MRRFLFLTLFVAGCGEPVPNDHFANNFQSQESAPGTVTTVASPVRIGELGPSFKACATDATTRNIESGSILPVRAAPFETGAETGSVPAGARFFVCSRTLDQKWLGIVYDEGGGLAARCGVSDPVTRGRAYDGPCRSGWVASAFVKLVAGVDLPPAANQQGGIEMGNQQDPAR